MPALLVLPHCSFLSFNLRDFSRHNRFEPHPAAVPFPVIRLQKAGHADTVPLLQVHGILNLGAEAGNVREIVASVVTRVDGHNSDNGALSAPHNGVNTCDVAHDADFIDRGELFAADTRLAGHCLHVGFRTANLDANHVLVKPGLITGDLPPGGMYLALNADARIILALNDDAAVNRIRDILAVERDVGIIDAARILNAGDSAVTDSDSQCDDVGPGPVLVDDTADKRDIVDGLLDFLACCDDVLIHDCSPFWY